MTDTLSALVTEVEYDDADVDNAHRLLDHHVRNEKDHCPACGQLFPCVPRRIAETVLRTASSRS